MTQMPCGVLYRTDVRIANTRAIKVMKISEISEISEISPVVLRKKDNRNDSNMYNNMHLYILLYNYKYIIIY